MATATMNEAIQTTKDLVPERRHASETAALSTAYTCLYVAFILLPLAMGADKFFGLMTNWEAYVAPAFTRLLGVEASSLLKLVGGAEIVIALGVLAKPRWFGYVASAWFLVSIINLLLIGGHAEMILRDVGLALAAFALSKLSIAHRSAHNLAARSSQREIVMY